MLAHLAKHSGMTAGYEDEKDDKKDDKKAGMTKPAMGSKPTAPKPAVARK